MVNVENWRAKHAHYQEHEEELAEDVQVCVHAVAKLEERIFIKLRHVLFFLRYIFRLVAPMLLMRLDELGGP